MPLTPAEVHNVAFKKPPIGKRGYDEEEVDAFLDIVEVELSRLIEENQELRARMANGETLPAADGAGDSEALRAELQAVRDENARLQSQLTEAESGGSPAADGANGVTLDKAGHDGAQAQVEELQRRLAETEQQLTENRQ